MKHSYSILIIIFHSLFFPISIRAQLNNADIISVPSGTYLNIQNDLLNNNAGVINNSGTIIITGDYLNDGNFNSANNSYVKLDGSYQQIGGNNTTTFSNLIIDGSDNKECKINSNVDEALIFNANNIIIGNYNLVLSPTSIISNSDNTKYVITNGNGSLVKKSTPLGTDFLFPVGDTLYSYKPVTLNYNGVVDTFSVRVAKGLQPTTGNDNECVQYTYFVEESNINGTNASLKLGWNSSDEGSLFARTHAYIWQYYNTTSSWNIIPGLPGSLSNIPSTDWYYGASAIADLSSSKNKFIVRSYNALTLDSQSTSQSVCESNSTYFSVEATGSNISYQWQENCGNGWSNIVDNATYSGTITSNLVINSPTIGMTGCVYQCIMMNLLDTITSQPDTLIVHALPNGFAGPDTNLVVGNSVQLNASGGNTYQWAPPSFLDNANSPNPITTPLNNIMYVVYITDSYGCSNTDTVNIEVDDATDIFIPDVFSPNGDGQNDILYVRGKGIKEIEFIIYDRWGEKVFESSDLNKGWDGSFKSKLLSTAVFVYYIKAISYNDQAYERKGNVTLIK